MAESHCPICYSKLEARDVAPCWDCGHDASELADLRDGHHSYDEIRVLGEPIVLCDFCQADWTSYDPAYFGQAVGQRLQRPSELIRHVDDPRVERDKVCPSCNRRLAFLRYLTKIRGIASA
jgi:ribosomal protein L37AE/L43A